MPPGPQEIADRLRALGFADADQRQDFGYVIPYVLYLSRRRGDRVQYMSLVTYEGEFCEAVFESFLVPRKRGQPKTSNRREQERLGYAPVFIMIYRTLPEILAAVEATP